jgi:hypothetical protein
MRDGLWVRESQGDAWGEPVRVVRDRNVGQPTLASTGRTVVLAAVSESSGRVLFLTRCDGRWSAPQPAFPAQSAIIAAGDTPLLIWCDGLPPIDANGWSGHDPERFRRRIFMARALTPPRPITNPEPIANQLRTLCVRQLSA